MKALLSHKRCSFDIIVWCDVSGPSRHKSNKTSMQKNYLYDRFVLGTCWANGWTCLSPYLATIISRCSGSLPGHLFFFSRPRLHCGCFFCDCPQFSRRGAL